MPAASSQSKSESVPKDCSLRTVMEIPSNYVQFFRFCGLFRLGCDGSAIATAGNQKHM
jgi:hypothetical protein